MPPMNWRSGDYGGAVEVVSLGFIKPCDKETVLNSAGKTGRVLIVQDEPDWAGYAPYVRCALDRLPAGKLGDGAALAGRRRSVFALLGRAAVLAVAGECRERGDGVVEVRLCRTGLKDEE